MANSAMAEGGGEKIFRALTLLYPPEFRDCYLAELVVFFEAERSQPGNAGVAGRVRFWLTLLRDLVGTAMRLRFRRAQMTSRPAGGKLHNKEIMATILQDIRFAVRTLAKAPAFTAIAVLTLGLGIGATTAVFNAVDVFMLRPLPYPDSDRLYTIDTEVPERGWKQSTSAPDWQDLRSTSTTMDVAAFDSWGYNLAGDARPERIDAMKVSGNFFNVLGRGPAMGRAFTESEEVEGNSGSAIISYRLWQRRFAGAPDILSRTVILDGATHVIVGVMPEAFWFVRQSVDVWTPLGMTEAQATDRNWRSYGMLARILDGENPDLAIEEAALISAGLEEAHPESNSGRVFILTRLHEDVFDEGFQAGTSIGALAVVFVLLIACANVANLVLARSAGRTREMALRAALGAGRLRIISQLLTESLIVALLGGVAGLAAAWAGIQGLLAVFPAWFPRVDEIGLDGRAIGFTFGAAVFTAVIFGLLPAISSSRPDLTESLKEGGRSHSGGGGRLRQSLVVAEMALALVLVVSSALLVKGFLRLRAGDYGFSTENVMTMWFDLAGDNYAEDEPVLGFYREAFGRVSAVRGVDAVGMVHRLPRTGNTSLYYSLPGDDREGNDRPVVSTRWIAGDYFSALGIPLLGGRGFSESDTPNSQRVVLINQLMAERHWPQGAIGQTFALTSGPVEIIGVVGNTAEVNQDELDMIFLPAVQDPIRYASFVVRTDSDPALVAEQVIAEIAAINPNLPLWDVQMLDDFIAVQDAGNSVMSKIMSVVALQALLLSIIGVYGVMTYSVSQRTREIGVRMALGASGSNVVRMIVRQGALLALLGTAIGLGLSLLVTRTLSFFLFGVSPFDLATYAAVTVTLLASGLVASYLPARRATGVDPMRTLRAD